MHCYICIFLVVSGHFLFAEQHDIVWGEYIPPQITQEEVASALKSKEAITLKPLNGGFSGGHIYSFTYNGSEYIARRTGGVYGQKGIAQEVAILVEANKSGLLPKMVYANSETGLIIMEKIDNLLPSEFCPGLIASSEQFLDQMAQAIWKIKSLQPDKAYVTERHDLYHLKKALDVVDISALPAHVQNTLRESISWPVEKEAQINHNDLHTRNLLYDGKNLYVIDWECAGWGPVDADVANFCNSQVMTKEAGLSFYARYLKRTPSQEEAERFRRQRVISALTNGMHGFSHWKAQGKNPLQHLMRESALESVKNLFFSLDRGKIDLRDDDALGACGLAWLHYASYLNNAEY